MRIERRDGAVLVIARWAAGAPAPSPSAGSCSCGERAADSPDCSATSWSTCASGGASASSASGAATSGPTCGGARRYPHWAAYRRVPLEIEADWEARGALDRRWAERLRFPTGPSLRWPGPSSAPWATASSRPGRDRARHRPLAPTTTTLAAAAPGSARRGATARAPRRRHRLHPGASVGGCVAAVGALAVGWWLLRPPADPERGRPFASTTVASSATSVRRRPEAPRRPRGRRGRRPRRPRAAGREPGGRRHRRRRRPHPACGRRPHQPRRAGDRR